MATMTITLPDRTSEWIEEKVRAGRYADASAYLRTLIEREHAEDVELDWPAGPELTLEELRRKIDESRASGPSGKTVADIMEEGNEIARARGFFRE